MKFTTFYITVLGCTFSLFSCQKKATENKDHLVFRYNEIANITSLDPAFAKTQSNIWACNQLFNGLVQLDDSLHIKPAIAKSWSVDSLGLTYLFNLRKDVYFHKNAVFGSDSTRVVTAQDVAFSFSRLTDPKVASPGGWILQQVANYQAVNDSVFEIKLKTPFPAFLGLLSMQYAAIVPKEGFENHDFRANPIGTGPFCFKLWEENIKLVLRKNNIYFEKDENNQPLPYLEAVAITFLPDKQSGFMEFLQGKIDFISGLDPSYKDELLTPQGNLQEKYADKITMLTSPYLNTEYLGFRMDGNNEFLKDIRLRQALNFGVDRKKMIAYLRNNMGIPANSGIIPVGMPGFNNQKGYEYNPEQAKKLVAKLKKDYKTIPEILVSTNASYIDLAEFMQREWQNLGLKVAIDVNPPSTLRQAIVSGKVSFFRASWIADYPDAENYLSLFYSKNFAPNGPNYTHFKNETYDALYEASFQEANDAKRLVYYQKMDSIIIHEAPIIPLFYDKVARFTGKNVSGLGINPLNLLNLKKVKKN
uniref:ABC transporter substrate-binding protein n=1 Tax=Flavobacterium sp. TaxID=239 RepID=UPI00404932DB